MSFSQLYTSLYHRIYVFFHRIPVRPAEPFYHRTFFGGGPHHQHHSHRPYRGRKQLRPGLCAGGRVYLLPDHRLCLSASAASIVGAFCINYFFMFPYSAFSLSISGYPVAMLSMVAISCIVCTLTARVKQQALDAVRREKNTKALYELNEKLNAEKAAMQLQSARENIRSSILRAVSHDLRTPLTSISGAISVLLSSPDMPEKNLSMLQDIKTDADDLIVMVENLLSVTRIQDGTTPLIKHEEMLEEVAGDAVLTTRRRFPGYNVELELPSDILYLPMDSTLIRQVIVNLLENAVRHSGDREHIKLNLFRQDDWAVVEVREPGQGPVS